MSRLTVPGLTALLAILACGGAGAREVPFLSGRVVDEAGVVPEDARQRIDSQLRALEESTGAQVAVLTISSLEGESLEDYSIQVVDTWRLGREDADDGVLLLVAVDDRQMRLEVGYGLEPVLTDATSGRILDGVLRPRFREGDFGGGIEAGVDAVAGIIRGEAVELPEPSSGEDISDMPLLARLAVFAFFLFIVGIFSLSALFGQGCQAWFLYLFLIPFWLLFPLGILGPIMGPPFFVAWLVGFPIFRLVLGKTPFGKRFRKTSPMFRHFGPGGAFASRGGGGSSGGFSGGGGSFGGGGASSSW